MYARVVRFTDASPERIDAIVARIDENDGPPEGVKSTGMKLLFDSEPGDRRVRRLLRDRAGHARFGRRVRAMDAGDTPGTRASIDNCEVKIEADA